MVLKYSRKKQKAETSSSFLPIGDSPVRMSLIPGFNKQISDTRFVNIYETSNKLFKYHFHLHFIKMGDPEFKTEGMFTVILQRPEKSSGKSSGKVSAGNWRKVKDQITEQSPSKIGKSPLKVLEMMYLNQFVTIPEMAKKLGITERAIEKNIQKLKEQNLVERREGERSGYWEITIQTQNPLP